MKSIKGVTRNIENVNCQETLKAYDVIVNKGKKVGVYPSASGWVIRFHHKSFYFDYHPTTKKIAATQRLNRRSSWSKLKSHHEVLEYATNYSNGQRPASDRQVLLIKKLSKELGIKVNKNVFKNIGNASDEINKLIEMKNNSEAINHFLKTGGL